MKDSLVPEMHSYVLKIVNKTNPKKIYTVLHFTASIYKKDNLISFELVSGNTLTSTIRYKFMNVDSGVVVQFSDIAYHEISSNQAYSLPKILKIDITDKKFNVKVIPYKSENKFDEFGDPHGFWKSTIGSAEFPIYSEEGNYNHGKKIGSWKYSFKGLLTEEIKYINDSLNEIKNFYNSGNTKLSFSLLRGDTVGAYTTYYENGNDRIVGRYILKFDTCEEVSVQDPLYDHPYDSLVCIYNSLKDDVWYYYNEQGKLIRKETYEQGKLIRKEDY